MPEDLSTNLYAEVATHLVAEQDLSGLARVVRASNVAPSRGNI